MNLNDLPDMSDALKKVQQFDEKKKLDAVGKEDGDVDNDGDKDSSDSYLMKRRKAIAKAMKKEEVETVNEISPDLAHKASKEADKKRGQLAAAGDKEGAAKKNAQAGRLYKAQAKKRLNREETEIIDDLVESGLFSDEEIQAILDMDEMYGGGMKGYSRGGQVMKSSANKAKKFLDDKAKKLQKEYDNQSDGVKNNPAFQASKLNPQPRY